jgi:hypothetical protein
LIALIYRHFPIVVCNTDRPETWHVHFDGVRVGVIVERSGAPPGSWQWCCGFYPGSDPGDDRHGTASNFGAARRTFEAAWRDYLPKRSEADFEEWRQDAAWHAAKYARWDRRGGSANVYLPALRVLKSTVDNAQVYKRPSGTPVTQRP